MHHFSEHEFMCKCGCGENEMKDHLYSQIDLARKIAGVPFVVTSGYRCEEHNKAVGGAKHSKHVLGQAADIKLPNDPSARFKILSACFKVFERIGIAKDFVHVDVAHTDTPVQWGY